MFAHELSTDNCAGIDIGKNFHEACPVVPDPPRTAANKVGIDAFHAGIGKILKNRHYLGDDYYPAIIDPDTFAAVQEERFKRASALGRIREPKEDKAAIYPTTFHIIEGTQVYDDPFAQAAYAYSLIESEV